MTEGVVMRLALLFSLLLTAGLGARAFAAPPASVGNAPAVAVAESATMPPLSAAAVAAPSAETASGTAGSAVEAGDSADAGMNASGAAVCVPAGEKFKYYERPQMPPSPFLSVTRRLLDLGLFAAMLGVGAWVVLSGRRRAWFLAMLLLSAGYFGFFRHGCICSVGAIGNVAQALTHPEAVIPVSAVLFFVLPLLLALLCGRVFCGTVCPLGAVQELLARRPQRIPGRLDRLLRLGPWLMLGWALVSAFVWLGFPICRMDPFVPLFRLAERASAAWGFTGAVLLLCVFVSRPYCRWLCPYGVLLGLVSRLAVRRRALDAGKCAACHRCAGHCPVGAITPPRLDFSACIQCGRCSRACTTKAVR